MLIKIIRDDLINVEADAIVVPANGKLTDIGIVAKDVFETAGASELRRECKSLVKKNGMVPIGQSTVTLAGDLSAKYIIHTVSPNWTREEDAAYDLLGSCYLTALTLADSMACKSIAFPLLSAGKNGCQPFLAFSLAQECIKSFEAKYIEEVIIVLYEAEVTYEVEKHGYEVQRNITDEYVLNKKLKKKSLNIFKHKKERNQNENIEKIVKQGQALAYDIKEDPKKYGECVKKALGIALQVLPLLGVPVPAKLTQINRVAKIISKLDK